MEKQSAGGQGQSALILYRIPIEFQRETKCRRPGPENIDFVLHSFGTLKKQIAGGQGQGNQIALYVYFDVPNPLHWLVRIHLRAPELLVTDELGPDF